MYSIGLTERRRCILFWHVLAVQNPGFIWFVGHLIGQLSVHPILGRVHNRGEQCHSPLPLQSTSSSSPITVGQRPTAGLWAVWRRQVPVAHSVVNHSLGFLQSRIHTLKSTLCKHYPPQRSLNTYTTSSICKGDSYFKDGICIRKWCQYSRAY